MLPNAASNTARCPGVGRPMTTAIVIGTPVPRHGKLNVVAPWEPVSLVNASIERGWPHEELASLMRWS
jgi:hypothetical protein